MRPIQIVGLLLALVACDAGTVKAPPNSETSQASRSCASGFVTGIAADGSLLCAEVPASMSVVPRTCTLGSTVTGIGEDGSIECSELPVSPIDFSTFGECLENEKALGVNAENGEMVCVSDTHFEVVPSTCGPTQVVTGVTTSGTLTCGTDLDTGDAALPWIDVRTLGAVGDGVTDDSAAVQRAVAQVVAMKVASPLSYASPERAAGWRGRMPTLYFPAGEYLIRSGAALTPLATALQGFNIRGAGFSSTRIVYDHPPTGDPATDYLIADTDIFSFSEIRDLWFLARNGTEKLVRLDGGTSAPSQSIQFHSVRFNDFAEAVTVTGANNSSELVFIGCKVDGVPTGGTAFWVQNNQSLNIQLVATDIEGVWGTAFQFDAGGILNVFGGSFITQENGLLLAIKNPTAEGHGPSALNYNFHGIRTEIRQQSRLFDVNAYAYVRFVGSNLVDRNTSTPTASGEGRVDDSIKGTITNVGMVDFDGCALDYRLTTLSDNNTFYFPTQPTIRIRNSVLYRPVADLISTELVPGAYNVGGIGKVDVKDSTVWGGWYFPDQPSHAPAGDQAQVLNEPVDATPNAALASTNATVAKKTFFFRVSPSQTYGLPGDLFPTGRFKLPVGAILTKVVIQKEAGGDASAWNYAVARRMSDGVTTTLATLSGAGAPAKTAISPELWLTVASGDTIEVTGDVLRSGYVAVEYY